jgi:hypothetical protein
MWPEDLRHLFAFDASGKAFTTPADLKGADVLVVAGKPGHDLITTLGGHTYEEGTAIGNLTGDRGTDAQAGTLEGMVTGLWGAGLPSYDATVAGDLVLYSKYQMLIANRDMLEGLTDGQRALLDEAVAAMREAAIERHFSEADLAEQLCAAGGTVIEAGPDALAAFRSAAQPLTDALAADPLTAGLLADIAALDESTAEAPGAGTCGGTEAAIDAQATTPADPISYAPSAEGFLSSAPPHDTYEISVTAQALQGAGASASFANLNAGTWTWSMSGGWWEAWHDPGVEHCWGTYMAEGDVVRFLDGSETTTCALGYDLRWQPVDGGITLEILGTNWTEATAQVLADERALAQRPWARIGDARKPSVFGGFTLGPPPDGTYRTELLATEMQARGASSQYAGENAGTWTLRFFGGTWEAARSSHDEYCHGTYEAGDDVVRFTDVPGGGCWMGGDYRFAPQDDGISILFVDWIGGGTPAEHQDWRSIFYEPWTRIADGSQPLGPGASAPATLSAAPVAALPPDGVYRTTMTQGELVEAGMRADMAALNDGTWTWSMSTGRWAAEQRAREGGAVLGECTGSYELSEDIVRFLDDPTGDCGMQNDFQWHPEPDGIRWEVAALGYPDTAASLSDDKAFYERLWTRIGDVKAEDLTAKP